MSSGASERERRNAGAGGWLKQQAPAWLQPAMTVLAIVQAAIVIAQAWWLADIVHRVALDGATPASLWPSLWLLAGILVLRAVAETLRGLVAAGASARVRSQMVPRLFAHMIEAGPVLRSRHGTGALATTLIERVDALDPYYARYLPQLMLVVVLIPAILAAVVLQDWLAGLFLALAAPLIPLFMVLIGMGTEALSRRQHDALARLGGVFLDRLRGMDLIRRLGAERRESARIGALIEDFRGRTMSVLRVAFLSTAVLEFFSAVAIAAVAIYIGLGLLGYIEFGPAPALDLKAGLFILLLAPEFFLPLRQLSQFWHDRAGALAAADAIREVLATSPARTEPADPVTVDTGRAIGVDIRGLGMTWPGRGPVLEGIDVTIDAGQRVVIAGPSGCGKSTLLKLMAGFVEPGQGRIRLGDMPLQRIAGSDLACLRGWMGQQNGLLNASLADNLRLGDPDADSDQLWQALELAGLADLCGRLPLGLDTPITQDGEGLSGGQARRLALARTLTRHRPLLLLDEPTASLDRESASGIWHTLKRINELTGATLVCASHDPDAVDWADRTLRLADGRIAEQGT
ncbi:thiol reductant ABC exporter subunit CydD [Wenzhouxiangella sp. AB-CW3]|uniref:thiol reductant ABC exporter subunit CydD n=1 Tax=Wenzhouxiangella sp. AB-CW3 TaxID=2771012 RepID=UPI00168AEE73|nr:thiol reductant ABC exporter subunit CydD [Wenzhouxiangella sp. AB-CW3]QOC23879.1 thiol reductant ABC exporter subunit CydD [Wenzhouxiangella sp. AB-CW3]